MLIITIGAVGFFILFWFFDIKSDTMLWGWFIFMWPGLILFLLEDGYGAAPEIFGAILFLVGLWITIADVRGWGRRGLKKGDEPPVWP